MTIALAVFIGIWAVMAVIALTNYYFVPRIKKADGRFGTALIPARNEAENLARLLPQLVAEVGQVIVFDDASEDGTAEVARSHGATVIKGTEQLPEGWVGKNYACAQLAKIAAEVSPANWWVFLDADTQVEPGFGGALNNLVEKHGGKYPVMTGFPQMLPGKFPEPVYLFWVPWALLSMIPFGLIIEFGVGPPRFTNGQCTVWNAARYFEINPHEECKGEVLEDIHIGRLLAKRGVPVLTTDMSQILRVAMYRTLPEAWRGMLKNSYYVTGNPIGALAVALLFFGLGATIFLNVFASLFAFATAVITVLATGLPIYCLLTFPLSIFAAGVTQLASMVAVLTGRVEWKGRRY